MRAAGRLSQTEPVIRDAAHATARGVLMAGLSVLGLLTAWALVVALLLACVGFVFIVPWPIELGRWVATQRRRLANVPLSYHPRPTAPEPEADGLYLYGDRLYKKPHTAMLGAKFTWLLEDRATWRDLVFLIIDPLVGGVLAIAPAALITYGVLTAPWGIVLAVAGFGTAPLLMRWHTRWSREALKPPKRTDPAGFSGLLAPWMHCFAFFGLSLLSLPAALITPIAPGLSRPLANLRRHLAGKWPGTPIAVPYLPGTRHRRDRATWRDLLFFLLDPIVGVALMVLPTASLMYATWVLLLPLSLRWLSNDDWGGGWYGQFAGSDLLAGIVGIALLVLATVVAPPLVRANGQWTRVLLSPTEKSRLALRVQELTETRAEATDAQAAELRRIEQDLHDGAEARLMAMGLGLGELEQLIDQDPAAAKTALTKVRDNSAKALVELRDLVRGIHPPVLAERGLGDAVRALALDLPMPTSVSIELPRRLEPPVESAAYFAISEALANATQDARATVAITLADDTLDLTVQIANADITHGLRGIERRLSAFDGTVSVDRRTDGTVIRMTLRGL
jgi:signal transduction histidine kinase